MAGVTCVDNTAGHKGGCLYVEFYGNNVFTGIITTTNFTNNTARNFGGAISFITDGKSNVSMNTVFSHFSNNTVVGMGGAIDIDARITDITVWKFTMCNFLNNTSSLGGAIRCSACKLQIDNAIFYRNHAGRGGSLYLTGNLESIIKHSRFNAFIGNMFAGSSSLKMANTSFSLDNTKNVIEGALPSTEVFVNEGSLTISPPFQVNCPMNHHLKNLSIYRELRGRSGFDYSTFRILSIKCTRCQNGNYSTKAGKYSYISQKNINVTNIKCNICPEGGNCKDGSIRGLAFYWGVDFKGGNRSGEVDFYPCPIGYCSKSPASVDSCAPNRIGRLCGECKQHHSLSMLSSDCIPDEKCEGREGWPWFLSLYLLLIPLLILVLVFTGDLKKLLRWLKIRLTCKANDADNGEERKGRGEKRGELCLSVCKKNNNDGNDVDGNDDIDAEGNSNDDDGTDNVRGETEKGNVFSKALLLFVFYQIQIFTKVPQVSEDSVAEKVQEMAASVFSIQFMNNLRNSTYVCLYKGLTIIEKNTINLCIWIYPLFTCLLFYSISKRYKSRFSIKMRNNLKNIFVKITLLCFVPVSTTLFNFVNCIKILQKNEEKKYLYIYSTIECHVWWQYVSLVAISLWVVPFPFGMYMGIKLIKQKRKIKERKIKEFFIAFCFPVSSLYFAGRTYYTNVCAAPSGRPSELDGREPIELLPLDGRNEETPHSIVQIHVEDTQKHLLSSEEKVIPFDKKSEEAQNSFVRDISEDAHEHLLLSEKKVIPPGERNEDTPHSVTTSIERQTHKDEDEELIPALDLAMFRISSWPAFKLFRNLSLAAAYIYCINILQRLYAIGFILLASLFTLVVARPYHDPAMYMLEVTYTFFLLCLDVISFFDILDIYNIPQGKSTLALKQFLTVFKTLILIAPIVLLTMVLLYTCVQKKMKPKRNTQDRKTK